MDNSVEESYTPIIPEKGRTYQYNSAVQKTLYGFLKNILSFKFNLKTKHLTATESLLTWEKISPNKKLLKDDNVDGSLACLSVSFHIIRNMSDALFQV